MQSILHSHSVTIIIGIFSESQLIEAEISLA